MSGMQAVVQYAVTPMAVELREVPVPEIGPSDILLKVGAVSVCGSDVHQAYGTHSWAVNIPVTLGHEFGGTVAAAGRDVAGFKEGDRVVSETAAVICGTCLMCRTGRYNLCPSRKGFGYGVNGAMAEYVKVPARCLHHVPDSLPFELACLTEPHSVAYNAMCGNAEIKPGDLVVVLGPGPIGLLCARMAALSGAFPLVVAGLAGDAARLKTARELGATHTVNIQEQPLEDVIRDLSPIGADVVCDASGASRPLDRRAEARAAGRAGGEGRLVARSDRCRSESARAEERPTPGLVQSQLPDLGARDRPDRRGPDQGRSDRRAEGRSPRVAGRLRGDARRQGY